MDKASQVVLQVTKELICKFIETRSVSPGNFSEIFPEIYRVIAKTVTKAEEESND